MRSAEPPQRWCRTRCVVHRLLLALAAAGAVVAVAAAAAPGPRQPLILFSGQEAWVRGELCGAVGVIRPDGHGRLPLACGDDAAWSPDGSLILIEFGDELLEECPDGEAIAVVRPDGRGFRRLACGQGAAWSPDGSRIAYLSTGELFVMGADGSGKHRLTRTPDRRRERTLTWSPDGRQLATTVFCHGSCDGSLVEVVAADGSGTRLEAVGSDPAWSPDGSRLAYLAGGGIAIATAANLDLPAIQAGFDFRTCGGLSVERGCAATAFSWSPDGQHVAFALRGDPNWDGALAVADAAGAGGRLLGDVAAVAPVWAPDGQLIVFERAFAPCGRYGACGDEVYEGLYAIRPDGSGARRLTTTPDWSPVWSPDGTRLAFARGGPNLSAGPRWGSALYLARKDGSCPTVLAAGVIAAEGWRPGASPAPALHCVDLSLRGTRSDPVILGGSLRYSFTIENTGDRAAADVQLIVKAPRWFRLSGTRRCHAGSLTVCRLGTIMPGAHGAIFLAGSVDRRAESIFRINVLKAKQLTTSAEVRTGRESDPADNAVDLYNDLLPCTIKGTDKNDLITGTSGRDWICARQGDDVIRGLAGDDVISAGPGDDVIESGVGNDRVDPGPERDVVRTRGGDDVVSAADGAPDLIVCGPGTDRVVVDAVDDVDPSCEQVERQR